LNLADFKTQMLTGVVGETQIKKSGLGQFGSCNCSCPEAELKPDQLNPRPRPSSSFTLPVK